MGFFEGLLGCLRPVWTIIGKATQAELKQQGKGKDIMIFFQTLVYSYQEKASMKATSERMGTVNFYCNTPWKTSEEHFTFTFEQ